MRVYYDWEFIDNGRTIKPLSLGMVSDTGEELYRIMGCDGGISVANEVPWLRTNVLPYLPVQLTVGPNDETGSWYWDSNHVDYPAVVYPARFCKDVEDFLYRQYMIDGQLSLWAYYAAYDHVCLAQLWGPMKVLPHFIPKRTNDIAQFAEYKNFTLENSNTNPHKAIDDARQNRDWWHQINEYKG